MKLTPRARARPGPDGNVSILMVAVVGLAALLCLAVATLGGAAAHKARADTAADAAALAAADQLALGRSSGTAFEVARAVAAENGAHLDACTCAGADAEVTVTLSDARARAHAKVGQ